MDTVQNTVDLTPLTWVPSLNPWPFRAKRPILVPYHFSSVSCHLYGDTTLFLQRWQRAARPNVAVPELPHLLLFSSLAGIIMFVSNKLP